MSNVIVYEDYYLVTDLDKMPEYEVEIDVHRNVAMFMFLSEPLSTYYHFGKNVDAIFFCGVNGATEFVQRIRQNAPYKGCHYNIKRE
jgi:hypothetical protein